MDSTSSPLSGNPEPSTAPSSATRQPTYTTAGTIYDPSSAAPLQPPARRGRALRGTMATSQADTIYQPKPVFETMPPLGRNAANRANLRHQYTPLQQNYDRASGPSRESGMVFLRSDMPARLSNAVNGKITEPTSPLPSQLDEHGQDDREYNHVRSKDQYRDDEDMASKPLQGLPINSLHNLASYPNPHRDNARRVILAASSDVSEQMRNSTQSGSWGHATPRGITALDRDASYFENTSTSTATFLPYGTSATGQGPVSSSAGDRLLSSATSPGLSPYTTGTGPVQYRDNKTSAAEGSLSLGLGAPKPLTAGPPGARQYRRPVLETTVQSVRPNSDTEAVDDLEDSSGDGLATSPNTTNAVFLPSTTPSPSESLSNRWHDARNLKKGAAGLAGKAASLESEEDYERHGSASLLEGSEPLYQPDAGLYDPWPGQRLWVSLKERRKIVDWYWFQGTHWMDKDPGVIGEGRPKQGKPEYPKLSIEEANRLPDSEHAEALLNVACCSLAHQAKKTDEEPAAVHRRKKRITVRCTTRFGSMPGTQARVRSEFDCDMKPNGTSNEVSYAEQNGRHPSQSSSSTSNDGNL